MDKPRFVYVTYIVTTPEAVWTALTDAETSRRFWGRENISDWMVGSPWQHRLPGAAPDVVGKVLESDPPRRLVMTWAAPADADNPAKHSRVACDIALIGEKVRLTVTHTEFEPAAYKDLSEGWSAVLSNLKTMLETGKTIPDAFGGIHG